MLEPASLGLDSAQKHSREEERHQGCSKIPDDEPGCNIQHQDVAETEDEKGVVGLEKPHPLHGGTELTEILHQLFVLAGLKAGLIWCQFPNQERVHVLPYQCLVKMKSNERILMSPCLVEILMIFLGFSGFWRVTGSCGSPR